MKIIKLLFIYLAFFIFIPSCLAISFDIESKEAILINLNDDKILYEKNSNEKTQIASLTKMMTAIVAIENIDDLNATVTINDLDYKDLIEEDASVSGYTLNTMYSYEELLYGLLLSSGADCANSLARNIAGDIPNFVDKMNEKASILGMSNSHFTNVTGLDDENNYSTANDVAILMKYAIKNETFLKIITSSTYTSHLGNSLTNTIDKYLQRYELSIPYLLGGKTGNTDLALTCLASILEYDETKYMLIVLNAPASYQFKDSKQIYEYYVNNYNYHNLITKGDELISFETPYDVVGKVSIVAETDYNYFLNNNYDKSLVSKAYSGKYEISPFMKKGDYLGKMDIYYDKEYLESIDIVLQDDIHFDFIKFVKEHLITFILVILSLILIVISGFHFLKIKKHKKKVHFFR